MRNFLPIYRRELWLAFVTPLAATLLVIYLVLSGLLTLTLGSFIEANQAAMNGFFAWQPWLFLFLGAALGMGQWADEYFSEDSGHLDCELKAEQVLADFNQETKFGWSPKKMTQHIIAYCKWAEHIHCYNPSSCTHTKKDGLRWVRHVGNNQQKTFYYIQSVKAFNEMEKSAAEAVAQQPLQTDLPFGPMTTDGDDSEAPF